MQKFHKGRYKLIGKFLSSFGQHTYYFNVNTLGLGIFRAWTHWAVYGERKSSGIERYRQELGTVPGVPLKRPARGTLNAGRRKRKLAVTVRHADNKPTTEGDNVLYRLEICWICSAVQLLLYVLILQFKLIVSYFMNYCHIVIFCQATYYSMKLFFAKRTK
jgi:hypothetical protein